jgi:glutamine amidotransferase
MFQGVPSGAFVYFTHTYAAPVTPAAAATTTHGVTFASAVAVGTVWGVQFHPEKSGAAGLAFLRNFAAAARRSSDGGS